MKKILSWVLIFMIISGIALAESEVFDLKSMSTSELITLMNDINDELTSRGTDNSGVIYSGKYVVGEDIFAGQYDFLVVHEDVVGYLAVKNVETGKEVVGHLIDVGQIVHLKLEEGQYLEVYCCSAIVMPAKKQSWMP